MAHQPGRRARRQDPASHGTHVPGHEDEYPEYDAYDAINVDSMRMMPDDHDGPMGVPLNFLERWRRQRFMLLGKLDDPTVNGRRLYKRLLVRRTRDA